jgi:hypothetical protein
VHDDYRLHKRPSYPVVKVSAAHSRHVGLQVLGAAALLCSGAWLHSLLRADAAPARSRVRAEAALTAAAPPARAAAEAAAQRAPLAAAVALPSAAAAAAAETAAAAAEAAAAAAAASETAAAASAAYYFWPLSDSPSPPASHAAARPLSSLGADIGAAFWPPASLSGPPSSSPYEAGAALWRHGAWARAARGGYPLSAAALARGFTGAARGGWAACAWARAAAALDAGEPLTMVVLGGSVTRGNMCGDTGEHSGPACAWPADVGHWLARARPRWRLRVVNAARGAFDAGDWARAPDLEPADIYVVDTSINVYQAGAEWALPHSDALLWRLAHAAAPAPAMDGAPPALLAVEAFGLCAARGECRSACGDGMTVPAYETLAPRYVCFELWQYADAEAAAARHYGIPVASYRDVVWPTMHAPPRDLGLFWQGHLHPSKFYAHELLADTVKYALLRLLAAAPGGGGGAASACARAPQPPPAPATSLAEVGAACAARPRPAGAARAQHTVLSPSAGFAPSPASAHAPAWALAEDVPGKPGWIAAAGAPPANLTFSVAFSAAPRLELTFLRSYAGGVGAATLALAIGPCEWAWRVDARIAERLSVPGTATLGEPSFTRPYPPPATLSRRRRRLAAGDAAEAPPGAAVRHLGPFPAPPCDLAPAGDACAHACAPVPGAPYTISIQAEDGAKFKVLSVSTC